MKTFAITLFGALPTLAAVSVVLPPGKTGTASFPGFSNAQSFRIEGRIHNRTPIAGQYAYAVQLGSAQNAFFVSWGAGVADQIGCNVQNYPHSYGNTPPPSPPADFEFRVQRIVTAAGVSATRTCEIWNIAADGAPLVYAASAPITPTTIGSGSLTIGHAKANISLAKLKVFSTTVPIGEIAPSASAAIGDVYNFNFEGVTAAQLGADTSGKGRNIVWNDGTAPATLITPAYAPVCNAGPSKSLRAGDTLIATAGNSWSRNDSPSLSYTWRIIGRPIASDIEIVDNETTAKTFSIRNTIFGQYTVGLTVADEVGSTNCSADYAVVAYNSNGVVDYPPSVSAAARVLIGPLTAYGRNPVPWAEEAGRRAADEFISLYGQITNMDRKGYWDDDPENWGPGTVTITENSSTVTCDVPGTCHFRTHICDASGVRLAGTNSIIFINYPVYEAGALTGENAWLYALVVSCPSDDQVILTDPDGAGPLQGIDIGASNSTVMSGRHWSEAINVGQTAATAVNAWSAAAPSAIDFYDPALAYYSLYYSTGMTKYLTAARWMADHLYSNPVNLNKGLMYRRPVYFHNGANQEPRDINLTGVILRALDGKPEYWTGIRRVCDYFSDSTKSTLLDSIGNREQFYAMAFLSACALADPDDARRAGWVTKVNSKIAVFDQWKCGGTGPFDCHGRHFGQWIRDGYSSCGSLTGDTSHACTAFGMTKTAWQVNTVKDSNTVTFSAADATGGSLTYPSNHASYPNQPIIFGNDPQDSVVCTGTGSNGTYACSQSPITLTAGMMVRFTAPETRSAASTLNINGLAARPIRLANGITSASLVSGTTYVFWDDGAVWRVLVPQSDLHIRSSGAANGYSFHWPQRVNSTTIRLRPFSNSPDRDSVGFVNWSETSGPYNFQIDSNIYAGESTQPFMMGIGVRALAWAYAATVAAGAPNATVRTLLSDAAKWLLDYGYDNVTHGLYYGRGGAGCEQPGTPYGQMTQYLPVQPGCTYDLPSSNTARGLTAEIFGGMSLAYLYEADATRKANIKTMMTKLYAKTYGKIGYPCTGDYAAHCADGYYNSLPEETYMVGFVNYHADKYFGFAYGFGGGLSTPAAHAITEFPRVPVPRTVNLSFRLADVPGATSIRATLRNSNGVTSTPVDCTSSPCVITVPDKTVGNYLIQIAYRASDSTLATSQWQVLANVD